MYTRCILPGLTKILSFLRCRTWREKVWSRAITLVYESVDYHRIGPWINTYLDKSHHLVGLGRPLLFRKGTSGQSPSYYLYLHGVTSVSGKSETRTCFEWTLRSPRRDDLDLTLPEVLHRPSFTGVIKSSRLSYTRWTAPSMINQHPTVTIRRARMNSRMGYRTGRQILFRGPLSRSFVLFLSGWPTLRYLYPKSLPGGRDPMTEKAITDDFLLKKFHE